MLQPKKFWSVMWLAFLTLAQGIPVQHDCQCGLFIRDSLRRPNHLVMTLENNLIMDCSDLGTAFDQCKNYCANEVVALDMLFIRDPSLLHKFPPAQGLSCANLPQETFSFSKICNHLNYILSSRNPGPSVCCNEATNRPIWCGTESYSTNEIIEEGRKLDLKKDKNDESLNEIDTEISMLTKFDKTKKPGLTDNVSPSSIMKTAMNFFGYNSIGDLVKGIDIFSLPGKLQSAVTSYKDEMLMGRCYMEFTTFKVFTKQENPFEGLLRKKRDLSQSAYYDDHKWEANFESDDTRDLDAEYRSHADTLLKVMGGLSSFLAHDNEGKQYASLFNTVLPVISQMMGSSGTGSAPTPLSMILNFVGPLLSQMSKSGRRPPSNNGDNYLKNDLPSRPTTSSSAGTNPLVTMAMTMIGNVISNFFQKPPGAMNRVETMATVPVTTTTTTTSTTPTPISTRRPMRPIPAGPSVATQAISSLMSLFLRQKPTPVVTSGPLTNPPKVSQLSSSDDFSSFQNKQRKNFADVLLEVIRPLFISIIGNTPGDSGVKEIRRVSSLSTLGRVDDTLRDEVDSPLFCFKKYMVNKAWSVTETGVRSIVSKLSPEEQERMMKRMLT